MKATSTLHSLLPLFKTVFDQSLDNVAVYDTQAKVVYCNATFLESLSLKQSAETGLAEIDKQKRSAAYLKA